MGIACVLAILNILSAWGRKNDGFMPWTQAAMALAKGS